ncbi:PP2C family serine/threonine-protein phosphatase [Guptibacillus hwajinpoensis]|uniref:PP2C family serine/threonine-protein phosphatase n=1 Tax=Guptibacillus hwajinpoensis TaxID=208199 RepID=UPI001CFDF278|nr:PP2C family serine/threonine-protein phosphatase [Pseudalkalibacillus hwajinpoensis]WLR58190.1 PP2C family serine/threonine-protein phosphatase [Pseudalkalibacillus hwajinpoensis]
MIHHHDFKKLTVAAYQKPKAGNQMCGDSYYVAETSDYFICAVADGLGSGDMAKDSSLAAINVVKEYQDEDVEALMKRANEEMRGKRGCVLSIFKLDLKTRQLEYSGIGNINLIIYQPDGKIIRPISYSGYLSGKLQKVKVQSIDYPSGSSFVTYSDGVQISSKNYSMIARFDSVKESFQHLTNALPSTNDDITLLVGKTV